MTTQERSFTHYGFDINTWYDDEASSAGMYTITNKAGREIYHDCGFRTLDIAAQEAREHINKIIASFDDQNQVEFDMMLESLHQ